MQEDDYILRAVQRAIHRGENFTCWGEACRDMIVLGADVADIYRAARMAFRQAVMPGLFKRLTPYELALEEAEESCQPLR